MSYNAGDIKVIKCEGARIKWSDVKRLAKGDVPEQCFLTDLIERKPPVVDGYVAIDPQRFWWSGEGSGWSWKVLIEKVCPKIMGRLEAVVTWEDGDSHGGLRILDGKVTEPEVIMTLAEDK